jgi:uncharacterized damage-inducible protein DinB
VPSGDVLADAFTRIHDVVHRTVEGLRPDHLTARVAPDTNTIAWLVWHLTRVQDDHVAGVAGTAQVWSAGGWAARFGLPFEEGDFGYGHTSEQVGAVQPEGALLLAYHDAVHATTVALVTGYRDEDLDRVVDTLWDPPVTLGARLVSVIADNLQHAGQAAYARGMLERG